MTNSEDIKIEIDGKTYVGWEEIAKKIDINISADLLRARVSKLGWTIEKAINTDVTELGKTGKEIFFKGKTYQTQEDFVTELEKDSPFSKTTLKIKLGKLNKTNPNYTENDLEEIIYGKNKVVDQGGFIYLITSIKTGNQYVGITIRSIDERWKAHQSECNDSSINSPLKREMREYGVENFSIKEIGRANNSKQLKLLEVREIKKRNTVFPNGLNANEGGTLGARDIETFEFEGVEYRSKSDLARKKGIDPGTFLQRINTSGMSIEEAISFEQDYAIQWEGKTYENLRLFCENLDLDYRRVISLRAIGYSIEKILKRLKDIVNCPICGTEFKRKSSIHKYCSEKCKDKGKYFNKDSKSQCGIPREILYKGKFYKTIVEFCKENNYDRKKMVQLLQKNNQDVNKAVNEYNESKGNKREVVFNGVNFESVSEFCREFKFDRSAFSKCLIKASGDIDKAIIFYKKRKPRKN